MSTPSRSMYLWGLAIVVMTIAAYAPVGQCRYIWDDDYYVTKNPTLRSVEGLVRIWTEPGVVPQYYPLVHSSFWIEYQLWELDPLGFHVVNVALHVIGALLWWRLLVFLGVPGAWFAAAVFALHPVHVESVAWITERKNVLSGVMYLLAAMAYFRFCPPDDDVPLKQRDWRWYGAAMALFVAALLSKTVTATLPPAILLVLWWKRGRIAWREAGVLAPFFASGIIMGMVTLHMEHHVVGARGDDWAFTIMQRLIIAGSAFWFYIGKLVWPLELIFIYPRWAVDDGQWWRYLLPATALALMAALAWSARLIGRAPLTAVLFFAGTLSPALGFFNVYPFRFSFVADHFQYLASMGVIALLAGVGAIAFSGERHRTTRMAAASSVLLALIVRTWIQIPVYKNELTLWTDNVARNPSAWIAHNNLGTVLSRQGRNLESLEWFRSATAIRPNDPHLIYNVGLALERLGDFNGAMDHYRQSLSILPGQVKPLFRMGLLLEHRGDIDGAVEHYRLAASSSRKAAISRCNLAGILANRGEHIEAASLLEEAREAAPRDVQILSQLGAVYVTMGRLPEAREAFSRAAELSPRNAKAHQDLGILLAKMGEPRLAVTHLSMAAELEPDNAAHFTNLGVMLHQTRQSARAVQAFDISLTIAPDLHSTLKNLAWILATDPDPAVRNPARAVELARKASKLVGPDNPVYLDTLAAALAAAGDFPQAVATAEHAATIARDGGATALADNIQRRLDLYRTQQPFIAATKP